MITHIYELRSRVIKSALLFICIFIISLYFNEALLSVITRPEIFNQLSAKVIATELPSTILAPMKLCFYFSILASMPYFLFHIWKFIAPGLFPHERHIVNILLFFSLALFIAGACFATWVMYPITIKFLISFSPAHVEIMANISKLLELAISMGIGAGIVFQMPVIVYLLLLGSVVTKQQLYSYRPYVIVLSFTIGMLLTPPDVISQVMLAVPMWLLYEIGIVLGPNNKANNEIAKTSS